MRIMIAISAAAFAGVAAPAASAQQNDASVGSYVCQFAGKCDTTTASDPSAKPSPPAPEAGATPALRTSETRGFRLAGAAPPAQAAPASARPAARTVHRSAPAAGVSRRVNLMLVFEYNSDAMTPAAQDRAKIFAQALQTPELRDKRFLIEGHTDARGNPSANLDLSRRRAQSVADFLIAQGVDPHSIDVKGVGAAEPLRGQPATAETNRRVEAVLLS